MRTFSRPNCSLAHVSSARCRVVGRRAVAPAQSAPGTDSACSPFSVALGLRSFHETHVERFRASGTASHEQHWRRLCTTGVHLLHCCWMHTGDLASQLDHPEARKQGLGQQMPSIASVAERSGSLASTTRWCATLEQRASRAQRPVLSTAWNPSCHRSCSCACPNPGLGSTALAARVWLHDLSRRQRTQRCLAASCNTPAAHAERREGS